MIARPDTSPRKRARPHLISTGIRRLRGCVLAQHYFPRAWSLLRNSRARDYVTISPLRGFEKVVGQISQLWKKVCVFQTQSIYYRSYRAGRRSSASAYAAISKIIALQAIGPRASAVGGQWLAARVETIAPYALASFVNGKFSSAGVEDFDSHCCHGRRRPRLTRFQASGLC